MVSSVFRSDLFTFHEPEKVLMPDDAHLTAIADRGSLPLNGERD